MLVTYTNASSASEWVSTLRKSLDAGASVQVRRTPADMDAEQGDKVKIQTGVLTVVFTPEAGDSAPLGITPATSLANYTNLTRPSAAAVAIYSAIYNNDDNAVNWSDGVNWRDSAGNIT